MASLLKLKSRKPVPSNATIETAKDGSRVAVWQADGGRTRKAPVAETPDGCLQVVLEASNWSMRYRDHTGRVSTESTGCREKAAAARVLSEKLREIELIKSGTITAAEVKRGEVKGQDIVTLLDEYEEHLKSKGCTPVHVKDRRHYLKAVIDWTGAGTLRDLTTAKCEAFLRHLSDLGKCARTRNQHRASLSAFGNWLEQTGQTDSNPYRRLPVANEQADRRLVRRALSDDEIALLYEAARGHFIRNAEKAHRGEGKADLKQETRDRLQLRGEERVLALRFMIETGIRLNECRTLTLANADLHASPPTITLEARHTKNRKAATLPLRDDLAAALRDSVASRLKAAQRAAEEAVEAVPLRLPGDTVLLAEVPSLKGFKADLVEAGLATQDKTTGRIDTRDAGGRVLDLHSLRGTAITRWAKAGVPLVVAQRLARHSSPLLTANHYTNLGLLDLAGAVEATPATVSQASFQDTPVKSSKP